MFVIPGIVTVAASLVVVGYFGWEAFRGYAAKIDTREEAKDFAIDLGWAFVGICAFLTALHSLVG